MQELRLVLVFLIAAVPFFHHLFRRLNDSLLVGLNAFVERKKVFVQPLNLLAAAAIAQVRVNLTIHVLHLRQHPFHIMAVFNGRQIVWRIAFPLIVSGANLAAAVNDFNHLLGIFVGSDVGRYDVSVTFGKGISNRFGRHFLHRIEQVDTSAFHKETPEAHVEQLGNEFFLQPLPQFFAR